MMKIKILWIINIVLPEALNLLNKGDNLKSSGGWLLSAANAISNQPNINLVIACPSTLVNTLHFLRGEKIGYYILPMGKGNTHKNPEYRKYWRKIYEEFKPDIIHIHGTEFSHGLAYIEECGADNVVVSIQGLVSVIANYYNWGLSSKIIFKNITFRDLFKGSLFQDKRSFKLRGRYEIELLQSVGHVIGRTNWDKAHVWAINPNAQYHFCNEILRHEFYKGEEWVYEKCVPHTIFLSQASYPIKGLHIVLHAMPLILKEYPDVQIRVAGMDITRSREGIMGYLKLSGYGKIIKSLIKKYHLNDHISFLGNLNASEMVNEYLRANVFVCPSSIENSPNSLGEAQILGTPVVACYAGGIPDMMIGNEETLYRFEEVPMLARKVCTLFGSKGGVDMKTIARMRHDRHYNTELTIRIYENILNS